MTSGTGTCGRRAPGACPGAGTGLGRRRDGTLTWGSLALPGLRVLWTAGSGHDELSTAIEFVVVSLPAEVEPPCMRPIRVAPLATLLLIVLPLISCTERPSSSGDLNVHAGCDAVNARQTMVGPQVVMDVRAAGCRDPDGAELPRDDAVDRVAGAVWQSLRLPVDAIHVRLWQPPNAGVSPPPVVIPDEELEDRFGPGPSGVVWPVLEHNASERILFLLPIAYVVAGVGALWAARRLVRAGVVVVFLRR
jgi:hypothetical protein